MVDRDSRDGELLRIALVTAVAIHGAVLVLPWTFPRASLPVAPPRPPLVLTPVHLPAPTTEPPPAVVTTVRRSLPVPYTQEIEDLAEPVREPDHLPIQPAMPIEGEQIHPEPVPPPVPAIVSEGHPGLTLPVRMPGAMRPEYPEVARRARIDGEVVLSAVVGTDGTVGAIEVVSAPSPDLGFSREAVRAVARWRYRPGTVGGRAVAVRLTVVVRFSLVR